MSTNSETKSDTVDTGNTENGERPSLPPVNFSNFIMSLNSSALVHLGELEMPDGGTAEIDLDIARQSIDILAMLQEKTRGNLTENEDNLLQHILYELRMKFIAASK